MFLNTRHQSGPRIVFHDETSNLGVETQRRSRVRSRISTSIFSIEPTTTSPSSNFDLKYQQQQQYHQPHGQQTGSYDHRKPQNPGSKRAARVNTTNRTYNTTTDYFEESKQLRLKQLSQNQHQRSRSGYTEQYTPMKQPPPPRSTSTGPTPERYHHGNTFELLAERSHQRQQLSIPRRQTIQTTTTAYNYGEQDNTQMMGVSRSRTQEEVYFPELALTSCPEKVFGKGFEYDYFPSLPCADI
ncbi:hypothetical protein HK098_005326 [Nowakowskiella sp. JEL0407]|nr:hypothetical protein HK098_005326 [Nowakowskiella sp. JEL0407]